MNEDEALFEARREIAQLRRKVEKLKIQNESLREQQKAQEQGKVFVWREAWDNYYAMMRKCERQRQAILQIQASPRGAKHWFPEYVIEEQESLEEALNECA